MANEKQSSAAKLAEATKQADAEKAAAAAAAKKIDEQKAAADAAAQAAGSSKSAKVPALSVVSPREGFRRGGRSWGKEVTVVKLSDLSREQIAQIKGEALLIVTEVEVDEEVAA